MSLTRDRGRIGVARKLTDDRKAAKLAQLVVHSTSTERTGLTENIVDLRALIFDVDGTLAETEEVHRLAFNTAFEELGIPWTWDRPRYRELLRVTGGKERLALCAGEVGRKMSDAEIACIHARKNALYAQFVRDGRAPFLPGVDALIRDAKSAGLKCAVCTTTSRANIEALLVANLGAEGSAFFDAMVCGEDVSKKKPSPEAYLLALRSLGLSAGECLALEDSSNGLKSARAAGIRTIVTPSWYSSGEDFSGALQVRDSLAGFDWRALEPEPSNR
jgi:HAD superfamily hydrolase (TIGR01509 family)